MSRLEEALLERRKWLERGHAPDEDDITMLIRNNLCRVGVSFTGISWIETEEIIEKAVLPLRREIILLRSLIKTEEAIP